MVIYFDNYVLICNARRKFECTSCYGKKIDGRRFFRSLVNPKCIIWLKDDQIYVIPVNKMSSDIHHYYFILLFVDNDGLFIHYICRFETTLFSLLFITFNSHRCCGSRPCWPSINRLLTANLITLRARLIPSYTTGLGKPYISCCYLQDNSAYLKQIFWTK